MQTRRPWDLDRLRPLDHRNCSFLDLHFQPLLQLLFRCTCWTACPVVVIVHDRDDGVDIDATAFPTTGATMARTTID